MPLPGGYGDPRGGIPPSSDSRAPPGWRGGGRPAGHQDTRAPPGYPQGGRQRAGSGSPPGQETWKQWQQKQQGRKVARFQGRETLKTCGRHRFAVQRSPEEAAKKGGSRVCCIVIAVVILALLLCGGIASFVVLHHLKMWPFEEAVTTKPTRTTTLPVTIPSTVAGSSVPDTTIRASTTTPAPTTTSNTESTSTTTTSATSTVKPTTATPSASPMTSLAPTTKTKPSTPVQTVVP